MYIDTHPFTAPSEDSDMDFVDIFTQYGWVEINKGGNTAVMIDTIQDEPASLSQRLDDLDVTLSAEIFYV